MYFLEDLKYNKLYKRQFMIPYNDSDKRRGSAILLLSPNYSTSKSLMNNPFVLDRMRLFSSYFIERDIMYTINNEGFLEIQHDDPISVMQEANYEPFIETTNIREHVNSDLLEMNDIYCRLGNKIIFFNELYDESIFNEALENDKSNTLNTKYRTLLYNDRLRNNKAVLELYEVVKADNPWIKHAYPVYERYKKRNLYIDLYYYNQSYLYNNTFNLLRSIDMYMEFINRFLHDKRISQAGYNKITVYLPVYGWDKKPDTTIYDYKSNLNPISVITKKMKIAPSQLSIFKDIEFVIFGINGYFKFNINNIPNSFYTKWKWLLDKLESGENIIEEDQNDPKDTPKGIAASIVEDIEKSTGAKINNMKGSTHDANDQITAKVIPDKMDKIQKELTKPISSVNKSSDIEAAEKDSIKKTIVKKIKDASENSADKDEALDKLNADEDLKRMIADLEDESDSGSVRISSTRSNRINSVNDALLKKEVAGKNIRTLIYDANKPKELSKTSIPIQTINNEWHELTAINFEKEYDLDADIVKCIYSLGDRQSKMYPIAIRNIKKEDTSTSEDYIYTYTVECEGYDGTRFSFKFDIPKLRSNRFMHLNSAEKVFSIEMPLLPISKTDDNTAQIATFYNKIFIRRHNTSYGKSNVYTDKLVKTLKALHKDKHIKILYGDNSRICSKYNLPIDYIDLASQFSKIIYYDNNYKENITIDFNQDILCKIPGVSLKNGIPYAITESGKVLYYTAKDNIPISLVITNLIMNNDDIFRNTYDKQSTLYRATYARAKLLNTEIPVIVILAHDLGLTKAMSMAGINYKISTTKVNDMLKENIKLNDGYIIYDLTYDSMMLMNGLKDCNLSDIKITDINKKTTWIEQLDNFGGRSRSDGLDSFAALMYDPVTIEVSRDYKLPETYHGALIYASNLLVDNKFVKHIDISNNRYRTNEVIAAQFYRVLAGAYRAYLIDAKSGKKAKLNMKQNAVINLIMQQNTTNNLSVFQPLLEIETRNQISTKGVTGLNSDRSYTLDKRGYDKSMTNIMAQSTSFAGNVGLNKQTTIDPQITGGRGYFKQAPLTKETATVTTSMGMVESLSPFSVSSDDLYRSEMTFVQTAKHNSPISRAVPQLITTGASEAMPYLCSDMFAFKAKNDGVVKELTDKYMLLEYKDKTQDYINLEEQVMHNADGGFWIGLQMITDKKQGQHFKANDLIAWDKKNFSKQMGLNELSYNMGCLAKVAIQTDENTYEDSGVCSEWLSNAMGSDIIMKSEVFLLPASNILYIAKKGQALTEGEPILIYQNAFDENDANMILKNLNIEDDDISVIGRSIVKSKVTGVLSDIRISRTCDISEMSDSMKKLVNSKESEINKLKKIAKNSISPVKFDPTEKLEPIGKLRNAEDQVCIEFFMSYHARIAIGETFKFAA